MDSLSNQGDLACLEAVLERCLGQAGDTADGDWARRHLTAVGYSSSRPLQIDGRESPEFSRRVVFNMSLNRNRLLEEIGGEVAATQAGEHIDDLVHAGKGIRW